MVLQAPPQIGGAYNTTTHSLEGAFPARLSDYVTPTKEKKMKFSGCIYYDGGLNNAILCFDNSNCFVYVNQHKSVQK